MEGIEWGLGPQDGPGCFAEQGEWGDESREWDTAQVDNKME